MKIKSRLHPHMVKVDITIAMPKEIEAVSDFRFMVSSTVLDKSAHVSRISAVQITILELCLKMQTHWRSPICNRYDECLPSYSSSG